MDNRFLEDIQKRLAKKLQPLDAPPRRTLRAQGLATDVVQPVPHFDHMDAELERMGFRLDGAERYGMAVVNDRLRQRYGDDVALKMAAKERLHRLGLLAGGDAAKPILSRLLDKALPPDAEEEEEKDTEEDPEAEPQASRTLRAAADQSRRGEILVDSEGRPVTLRSIPD